MRKFLLTTFVVLPFLVSCSSPDAVPESGVTTTASAAPTFPATTPPAPASTTTPPSVALIDVTTLVRSENIYAASAANAIAAAAFGDGAANIDWSVLRAATSAIDSIEYPEIVEGLEVLEIDEIAIRVLTTNSAASGGDWGESYVCITGAGVVASETLCTGE